MLGMTKAPVLDLSYGAVWDISAPVGLGDCPAMGQGMDPVYGLGSFTSSLVFLASPASKFPISLPGKQGGAMETGTAEFLLGLEYVSSLDGKILLLMPWEC